MDKVQKVEPIFSSSYSKRPINNYKIKSRKQKTNCGSRSQLGSKQTASKSAPWLCLCD